MYVKYMNNSMNCINIKNSYGGSRSKMPVN
jgi:hypothetical protein